MVDVCLVLTLTPLSGHLSREMETFAITRSLTKRLTSIFSISICLDCHREALVKNVLMPVFHQK